MDSCTSTRSCRNRRRVTLKNSLPLLRSTFRQLRQTATRPFRSFSTRARILAVSAAVCARNLLSNKALGVPSPEEISVEKDRLGTWSGLDRAIPGPFAGQFDGLLNY